jgi:hypothetical protein
LQSLAIARRAVLCPVQLPGKPAHLDGPPMIRVLRLLDLVGVAMFLRQDGTRELTSHTWPRVQPETGHLPTGAALWQTFGWSWERVWLAATDRDVAGLIVARPRCGGLVWDVEHLLTAPESNGVAEELLETVGQYAAAHGARRIFLEVPDDEHSAGLAQREVHDDELVPAASAVQAPDARNA